MKTRYLYLIFAYEYNTDNQKKDTGKRGKTMCFYIGIEDLAANALIEILKTKEKEQYSQCYVTLSELEAYGNQVIR